MFGLRAADDKHVKVSVRVSDNLAGAGEDAEPVAEKLSVRGEKWTALAVFDGLGGSGSRPYALKSDRFAASSVTFPRSGGFHGADAARAELAKGLPHLLERLDPATDAFGSSLGDALTAGLRARLDSLETSQSEILTRNDGELPTTVALALIKQAHEDAFDIYAYWGGDSRIFVLREDADKGLALVSLDDTSPADPDCIDRWLERSVDERGRFVSDVSNRTRLAVGKGAEWRPSGRHVVASRAALVIVMTDGVYGTIKGGLLDLEREILQTVLEVKSLEEFSDRYLEALVPRRDDDISFAIAVLVPFEKLRQVAKDRLAYLAANPELTGRRDITAIAAGKSICVSPAAIGLGGAPPRQRNYSRAPETSEDVVPIDHLHDSPIDQVQEEPQPASLADGDDENFKQASGSGRLTDVGVFVQVEPFRQRWGDAAAINVLTRSVGASPLKVSKDEILSTSFVNLNGVVLDGPSDWSWSGRDDAAGHAVPTNRSEVSDGSFRVRVQIARASADEIFALPVAWSDCFINHHGSAPIALEYVQEAVICSNDNALAEALVSAYREMGISAEAYNSGRNPAVRNFHKPVIVLIAPIKGFRARSGAFPVLVAKQRRLGGSFPKKTGNVMKVVPIVNLFLALLALLAAIGVGAKTVLLQHRIDALCAQLEDRTGMQCQATN